MFEEFQPDTASPIYQADVEATKQPQGVSLDQKVDHFLIQYEKESMPRSEAPLSGMNQQPALMELLNYIFEADDPSMDAGGAPPPDAGMPPSDPGGASAPTEPTQPTIAPKINLNNFAARLARLVSNYDTLLDPRTTILLRAQTYIAKNYNQAVAKELMIMLETEFNLTPKTKIQQKDEVPTAIAAGALGSGGGGGGAG